jgi:hypothetical protein
MPRKLIAATAVAVSMSVSLLGCTSVPTAPAGRASHPAPPVTAADARHCPVTIGHPVPNSMPWRDSLFGWPSAYGNRSMWVGSLWTHGVVIITPDNVDPDGRLGMKFGWYQLTSGHLTITGRRLDAPAPPSSGQASSGYGPGFSSSELIFPTEGCWQVTGRVGKTALTFVTFVIKGHCDLNADPIRCVADHAR